MVTNELYISKALPKNYLNHPAVKWWVGHANSLAFYIHCMTDELYVRFGNKKTLHFVAQQIEKKLNFIFDTQPPTFLTQKIINSHRSSLLYKTELNAHLYDFCYKKQVPLSSITKQNFHVDFVPYLLTNSNIMDVVTMRFSTSKQIPSYSSVQKQFTIYNNYKYAFPKNEPELNYVW